MAKTIEQNDPYAPPPMHHDKSGSVLRGVILAGMLGAAALGYVWYSGQERTALVPEIAEEQQMADAGYTVQPQVLPETTATETAPTSAPAAAPATQRRSAPVERAPEPTPVPEAVTPAPQPIPATPTPLPPTDMPPVGTTGMK